MSWSFKLARNDCWMCGLVPIGKKDYRGSLSRQLICLEGEKEAFVVTPNYEPMSGKRRRHISTEREMDFYGKEIEVFVLNILFSLFFDFELFFFERFKFWENKKK